MGKIWIEQNYAFARHSTAGRSVTQGVGALVLSGRIEHTSHLGNQTPRSSSTPDFHTNGELSTLNPEMDGVILPSTEAQEADVFQERISRMASSLTRSELHVCGLIRKGVSSKDIGLQLGTSQHTVFTHRKSIRRKLGLDPKESLYSVLIRL